MILVDTSVWIDFLRGRDTLYRHRLHDLIENGEDIGITGIILTEILQGIKDEVTCGKLRQFLLEFPIHNPGDIETYVEAANIYRQCARRGKIIRKTVDCIIAAVAIENDFVLLHNDADFHHIARCTRLKTLNV